jgi:hypothetical protein
VESNYSVSSHLDISLIHITYTILILTDEDAIASDDMQDVRPVADHAVDFKQPIKRQVLLVEVIQLCQVQILKDYKRVHIIDNESTLDYSDYDTS